MEAEKTSAKMKYTFPNDYLDQIRLARDVFFKPPAAPTDLEELKLKPQAADFLDVMSVCLLLVSRKSAHCPEHPGGNSVYKTN